jgi:hypothetical protein
MWDRPPDLSSRTLSHTLLPLREWRTKYRGASCQMRVHHYQVPAALARGQRAASDDRSLVCLI